MLLVGYQLLRLRRNLRRGVFGSRLALRLVLLFALVAVLPGALVYAVSVQFLGKSIESWFDVRVDRALEGGLNLGRNALDYLLQGDRQQGRRRWRSTLGEQGAGAPAIAPDRVRRAGRRRRGGAVLRRRARCWRSRASASSTATPEPPPAAGAAPGAAAAGVRRRSSRGPRARCCCASSCRSTSTTVSSRCELLQVVEPVPQEPRAGRREGAGGLARLPGDLVLAAVAEAALRADADADAAARAHVGARPRRRAVGALRRAAGRCWPRARARSRRATSRAASR